jgi:tyrosine-protein kinase Etk/Wzc
MIDLKQRPTAIDSDRWDASQMVSLVRIHSDLIQSQPVLKTVVEKLKLYEDLAKDKNNISDSLKEKLSRSAIDLLAKKYLTVISPAFTNLIQIKVKYKNPEKAAEIANTLVDSYIKWSVDFLHRETKTLIEYLNKEIEVAKQNLQISEEALEKFRNEYKVISLPEEVRAKIQLIPEEIKTHLKLIQVIDVKLLELEVELSRINELYTDESPQVVFMKERIAALKELLDSEHNKSIFGESYFTNLKDIPEKEMLFDRLQRRVKINEDLYLLLLKEHENLKLLDAKKTTENIKIVSSAITPLKPSGRVTGLVFGAIVSFFFSLVLAFILELRKVR